MKTISTREFFHKPDTVEGLHAGESIPVTKNSQPEFVVTKAGGWRRKPMDELRCEIKQLKGGKPFDLGGVSERPAPMIYAALELAAEEFVTFDDDQATLARAAGLTVATP